MAQQQPAVVMIARHGMRLDAADSSWHLSTPTPYDPPLTYGGWNQCRALGNRIANLLHEREEEASNAGSRNSDNARGRDFSKLNENDEDEAQPDSERPKKKRRIKHKVVIHSSPYLRCLETGVAIAAGMAQYKPQMSEGSASSSKPRSQSHSRLHAPDGLQGPPRLSPVPGERNDFAHAIARKALYSHRHRKSTLRVDAFLGEWLNPSYFDSITPPPPSSMMVATAKAELMQNDTVEIFQPAPNSRPNSGTNNLWGGGSAAEDSKATTERSLDDWNTLSDGLPPSPGSPTSPSRSRASTTTESGRKSPFRPERTLKPLISTLPKQEIAIYHPPQPHYAISASSQIPQGYVAHARNACCNVDASWDSSRPPHDWGDGGDFGEEWSAMHKRVRRGFNGMIAWYSRQHAEHPGEDTLGLDHSGLHGDEEIEEQEDLVLILITHGAGCNALIGALTGQPVLLDVGMASLTMAVRRDDAPSVTILAPEQDVETANGHSYLPIRRGSSDTGISSVYDMKLVASSSHMHPAGVGTGSPSIRPLDSALDRSGLSRRSRHPGDTPRNNTSAALGSIRRPSAQAASAGWMGSSADRASSMPPKRQQAPTSAGTSSGTPSTPGLSAGLWTPPVGAARSPGLSPFMTPTSQPRSDTKATLPEIPDGEDLVLDFSNLRDNSKAGRPRDDNDGETKLESEVDGASDESTMNPAEAQRSNGGTAASETLQPEAAVPPALQRGSSQKGLWASQPQGAVPTRAGKQIPKRRWTVDQD